jgi:hypothetical protein
MSAFDGIAILLALRVAALVAIGVLLCRGYRE